MENIPPVGQSDADVPTGIVIACTVRDECAVNRNILTVNVNCSTVEEDTSDTYAQTIF